MSQLNQLNERPRPDLTGAHAPAGSAAKRMAVFNRAAGVLAAALTFAAMYLSVTKELAFYHAWGRIPFALFMAAGAAYIAYGLARHWLLVLTAITIIWLIGLWCGCCTDARW